MRHDTGDRHFEQLWRDDHVDVWVISWATGNDTGFHDHDVSRGAVAVMGIVGALGIAMLAWRMPGARQIK